MIRAGEAARVPALFFLVPLMIALLAWLVLVLVLGFVLGQTVAPLGWAGLAVSAAGMAVVTLERRRCSV